MTQKSRAHLGDLAIFHVIDRKNRQPYALVQREELLRNSRDADPRRTTAENRGDSANCHFRSFGAGRAARDPKGQSRTAD
jgi:hypothetical protein